MPKISAGLLMYRIRDNKTEFFLIHHGGPFFKNKDNGFWGIPKGKVNPGEEEIEAAKREFKEETGFDPIGELKMLTPVKMKSGKIVKAWTFKGDCNPGAIKSNTVKMMWPPLSGRIIEFPEVDRAGFFEINEAKIKMNPAQIPFLKEAVII